ncbi:hypothetical protein J3E68DRAFT_428427 [Trichoderma sp. SZMC 28012]
MLKVNDNHSADEENVHIHIAMKQQQAAKPVKMGLASGQVMDAGRLSINFLQQDSHGVSVVSQMAEEFGETVDVHTLSRAREMVHGKPTEFSSMRASRCGRQRTSSLNSS